MKILPEQIKTALGQFQYIESPNLPEAPVCLVLIDGRINAEAEDSLRKLGVECIKTQRHPKLPEEVAYHPDMMFCHLGDRDIVYAPETGAQSLLELRRYGFNLIEGKTSLIETYPHDIAYNAAIIGRHAFHDFRYTDSVLLNILKGKGIELVNIKQGYSRCSISILNTDAVITSDKGISKAMFGHSVSALTVEPDVNIKLGNFKNGFIGGCTGKIDSCKLVFTGNAEKLASFGLISDYMKKNKIKHISLGSGNVLDMGSVIPLATR